MVTHRTNESAVGTPGITSTDFTTPPVFSSPRLTTRWLNLLVHDTVALTAQCSITGPQRPTRSGRVTVTRKLAIQTAQTPRRENARNPSPSPRQHRDRRDRRTQQSVYCVTVGVAGAVTGLWTSTHQRRIPMAPTPSQACTHSAGKRLLTPPKRLARLPALVTTVTITGL